MLEFEERFFKITALYLLSDGVTGSNLPVPVTVSACPPV